MFEEQDNQSPAFEDVDNLPAPSDKTEASLLATTRSVYDPSKSVVDHYNDVQNEGVEAASMKEGMNSFERAMSITEQIISEDLVTMPPEHTAEVVKDAQEAQAEDYHWLTGEMKSEISFISSMENRFDKNKAAKMWMEKQVARSLRSESSYTDWGKDIAGLLFIPDYGFDASDVTGSNWFGSGDAFARLTNKIKTLPIEEKLAVWPAYLELLKETTTDLGHENQLKFLNMARKVLDPYGEEEISTESFLDLFDVATLGASAVARGAGTVYKAAKSYNTVKKLKEVEAVTDAARANEAVLADTTGKMSEITGVSKTESALNQHPAEWDRYIPGTTENLTEETERLHKKVEIDRKRTQETLQPLVEGKASIKESRLLSEADILAAKKKALEKVQIEEGEDLLEHGYFMSKSSATTDETGINVTVTYVRKPKFKLSDDKEPQLILEGDKVEIERRVMYQDSDVGILPDPTVGAIQSKLWSPEVIINKMMGKDGGLVEMATRIGFAQEVQLSILRKAAKDAWKGIGYGGRRKLNKVLLDGDDQEKVFDIPTLKTQYGLSNKEVSSYYQTRDIMDTLHFLKNKQIRDRLEFEGWKNINISLAGAESERAIGKGYERIQDIPSEVVNGRTAIWDGRSQGKLTTLADDEVEKLYSEGYRVVKFRKEFQADDVDYVDYALIKADDIEELPYNVLNKRKGYVPKSYEDGFYWVKQSAKITKNGVPNAGTRITTLRAFDNKTEAEAFRLQMESQGNEAVKYITLHDREKTFSEMDEDTINEIGGLYTSPRGNREILFGAGEGEVARRTNALESIQRNIQHISTQLPLNEFRMDMVNRWLNTARRYVDDPGKGINAEIDPSKVGGKGTPLYRGLKESQDWIRDQLRIPTESEQIWQNTVRSFSEWMEAKVGPGAVPRALQRASKKDPFSAIRGTTFHTLLGWFNPVQMFVQAQGAAIALAVDGPAKMGTRLPQYMALRGAYFLKKEEDVRLFAKTMGIDAEELVENTNILRKSGLFESISTTADLSAAQQGFGLASEYVRNAARKGLIFYAEGERFTRGYSFLAAKAWWKERNPGRAIDDKAMREILSRTVDKMFNMNRANRAYWQKGVWSVPTQFKQYTAKFMEAVLPQMMIGSTGKFTAAEKRRILLTQVALYGAAGVPFGDWVAREYSNLTGREPSEMSDVEKATITDGIWGAISEMIVGDSLDLGSKGAAAEGITTLFKDFFLDPKPYHELALGAFSSVGDRGLKALGSMAYLLADPDDIEWTKDEYLSTADELMRITSTWNNLSLARMWENHSAITTKDGIPLVDLDLNKDMKLIWAKRLGFSPNKLQQFYTTNDIAKDQKQYQADLEDGYRKALAKYILPRDQLTETDVNNFKKIKAALFKDVNPVLVGRVVKKVNGQLFQLQDPETKRLRRVLENNLLFSDDQVPSQKQLQFRESD